MGENSKIEWCHHTFNPWYGCTKVSPACDHCYAEAWAKRSGLLDGWGKDRRMSAPANWKKPLKWANAAAYRGVRERVFSASLADVFDNQVRDEWRADLWALIAQTRRSLDWLLLTKRPQNIAKMLPTAYGFEMMAGEPWPWSNVWLGTTVENQEEADRRIPALLETPAAVRFLSCEPLLGPVNLKRIKTHGGWYDALEGWRDVRESPAPEGTIDWIIVGGESGPRARPMNLEWMRSLRDQCKAADVAFFAKQLGSGTGFNLHDKKGGDWNEWPADLRVREFPNA